jgi:hypothetical protein
MRDDRHNAATAICEGQKISVLWMHSFSAYDREKIVCHVVSQPFVQDPGLSCNDTKGHIHFGRRCPQPDSFDAAR